MKYFEELEGDERYREDGVRYGLKDSLRLDVLDEAIGLVDAAIAKGWVEHLPKYYEPLKKRDRVALVNFLRKQQAGSIETLGLTDYWQQEPFPLEVRK